MTPDEFHEILTEALKQHSAISIPVWSYVIFAALTFAGGFFGAYFKRKGENYATKEDIECITDKVESVKADYAKILEEVKSDNQLKIASIEREKQLKKEVYMEAAEALTRSLNMKGNFANLNNSEESLTARLSSDSGKIAKVQIVGTGDVVKAVTALMNAIGEVTMSLMLERKSLVHRKAAIEVQEEFRNRSRSEVDRYILIMKNQNLEGNTDRTLWDTIDRSIEFENQQIKKYSDEIDRLSELQNKEHAEYSRKCMDTFFEVSSLVPEVVLSVRKDLDLDIEPDEYAEIYTDSLKKGKSVFDEFMQNV